MTKLPKRLEKVIEQKAEDYAAVYTCPPTSKYCKHDVLCAHKKSGTDIALEVLKEAQKLVDAIYKYREEPDFTDEQLYAALSDWQAFVGEESVKMEGE